MLIRVGMEEYPGNRYTAWALDFPGCFAYGADEAEALLTLPRNLLEFDYWVRLHTNQPWFQLDGMDFHVDETFTVSRTNLNGKEYEINAFFQDDLRPLTQPEVNQTLKVLHWQQEELLAGIESVNNERLYLVQDGQRRSILGVVRHLAFTELWYLQNLSFQTPELQQDINPILILEQTYNAMVKVLPVLVSDINISGHTPERWSARKLIRRTLWQRRDHIDHIRKLLGVI